MPWRKTTWGRQTHLDDALEDGLPVEVDLALIEFDVDRPQPLLLRRNAGIKSCSPQPFSHLRNPQFLAAQRNSLQPKPELTDQTQEGTLSVLLRLPHPDTERPVHHGE